ncbi:MAG: hypothetical protein ACRDRV_01550 [Pseudonocardiaceae bacterium]
MLRTLARNLIGTIPPRDLTATRIAITETRISSYWKAHGRLPARLSDLPALKRRDNSTIDGWGRPIAYRVSGTVVTLSSSDANDTIEVVFDVGKGD